MEVEAPAPSSLPASAAAPRPLPQTSLFRQLQAAARDLVEVRRRRADGDAAAVAAEIAPADIVHEIDEDVGLLLACGEFSRCGFDVFPVHESGFEMVCLAHGLRCDGVESRHVSSVDLRANYSLAASVAMARASAVSGAP